MNGTSWILDLSAGRVALAALAVGLSAVMAVALHRRARGPRGSRLVEGLRLLFVLLLAATLLRPERVRRIVSEELPRLAIGIDASGSMATRDIVREGLAPVSRADWIGERIEERFWAPLEEAFDVAVETFDTAEDAPDPAEHGTDLHGAIERAVRADPPPRALLLLSDGDWNLGPPPALAAADARARGVPVYTVTVGRDRHLPDLDLHSLAAPAFALVEETVSIPFSVRNHFAREVRTEAVLRTAEGVEVARRALVLPPLSRTAADLILASPREAGAVEYTLALPVEPGEAREDNNAREFRIDWRREQLRVLVLETEPRWEYRFLRNALVRDPGVSVDVLLLHPEIGPAAGPHYRAAFPDSRAALSDYDVVFVGDIGVADGELTEDQARLLAELTRQQAGGLIFLPGPQGRQRTLRGTELEALLPVEVDLSRPTGSGFPVPARLLLTEQGRDHFLTRLASDPERNEAVWRALPGFHWQAPVLRARPGAEILAVHSDMRTEYGRMPLLVTRPAGRGQVLFMGTDAAWRWRRGVEDTFHYRFWGQVVRWMARQRHLARTESIRFFYHPETPSAGDRVFFHATAFDAEGAPLEDGLVEMTIRAPDGGEETVRLTPEPGGWGVFTGSWLARAPGRHLLRAVPSEADGVAEAELTVTATLIEAVGQPARPDVMDEIARVSGGESAGTDGLAALLERIRALPVAAPREERLRLWSHPAWVGFLLLVGAAYWAGRKLLGRL